MWFVLWMSIFTVANLLLLGVIEERSNKLIEVLLSSVSAEEFMAGKLLGIAGGLSMVLGTVGLWRLNLRRHPLHGDAAQKPMDRAFIALLFLTATSGLALWAARDTAGLPPDADT